MLDSEAALGVRGGVKVSTDPRKLQKVISCVDLDPKNVEQSMLFVKEALSVFDGVDRILD